MNDPKWLEEDKRTAAQDLDDAEPLRCALRRAWDEIDRINKYSSTQEIAAKACIPRLEFLLRICQRYPVGDITRAELHGKAEGAVTAYQFAGVFSKNEARDWKKRIRDIPWVKA